MGILGKIIDWRKNRKLAELKKSFKSCGEKIIVRERVQFNHHRNIEIGNNVLIQRDCTFSGHGGIKIGDGCVFAHCVDVFSGEHNYDSLTLEYLPFDESFITAPVEIGDYAWIGSHVIILPGVSIGEGAIIGAGAIVTKSIPAGAIAVGNPARVIRYRDMDKYYQLKNAGKSLIKLKR